MTKNVELHIFISSYLRGKFTLLVNCITVLDKGNGEQIVAEKDRDMRRRDFTKIQAEAT